MVGACNTITKFCSDPFCVVSGACRVFVSWAREESLAQTSRPAPERVPWACAPDAPAGTCRGISVRYIYRSCSRIILKGCRAITILKRPLNRVFQHFFVARRPLASLRSTLNYANLCTWSSCEQFTSYFGCLVVKYHVNHQFFGEKIGVFSFYKVVKLCVLIKNHVTPAACVVATCREIYARDSSCAEGRGLTRRRLRRICPLPITWSLLSKRPSKSSFFVT